jgi:hypothetical protein
MIVLPDLVGPSVRTPLPHADSPCPAGRCIPERYDFELLMIGTRGKRGVAGSGGPRACPLGGLGPVTIRKKCVLDRRIPAGLGVTRARAHPTA